MKKACLCNLSYLLLAILMMAMTGCGASNSAIKTDGSAQGAAKMTLKYPAAKATASIAAPASLVITVTGTGLNGKGIPVVRVTSTDPSGGTVNGIYPGNVTVAVKALDAGSNVIYEGYALNVGVAPNMTTNVGVINMTVPLVKTQDAPCVACHETTLDVDGQNLVAGFKQSGHYKNQDWTANPRTETGAVPGTGCAGCHGPSHNDPNPASSGRCYECHGTFLSAGHATVATNLGFDIRYACEKCHAPHNTKSPTCVGCHSLPQNAHSSSLVADNNGVRVITTEFAKWSHHVTGVKLRDAHCAACHLEGTVQANSIVVDASKHMADNKVHLRNADTDADMAWDPANPTPTGLSGMDNFCMACHDANGATSATEVAIQGVINSHGYNAPGKTASASNPFGDTISNRYDKMQRPAVVDVSGEFDTANYSHHAVKGAKYTGRTRVSGAARAISSPATFAANSSATLYGARSTIYDAGNFNSLYVPLGTEGTSMASLGDDSTLHCGDCHTVGQWKPGVATNEMGQYNTAAIGAHGSNNEYLLRNTAGTDQRHTSVAYTQPSSSINIYTITNRNGALLVCFNCHAFNKYGSPFAATGKTGPHAGEYDAAGRCNGAGNTISFTGYTSGNATDGTQFETRFTVNPSGAPYAGEQKPDFGNVLGIQCLNCHNSGPANGYGGIHGSKVNTYTDGMGNQQKTRRFLPGLGNTKYVPGVLGGITGGTTTTVTITPRAPATPYVLTYTTGGVSNDTNWEQKSSTPDAGTPGSTTGNEGQTVQAGAGCYTLSPNSTAATYGQTGLSVDGGATTPELLDTWGGCEDHGAAQGGGDHGTWKRINRPVTY